MSWFIETIAALAADLALNCGYWRFLSCLALTVVLGFVLHSKIEDEGTATVLSVVIGLIALTFGVLWERRA